MGFGWQTGDPTVRSMAPSRGTLQSGSLTHLLMAAATVTAMPSGDGSAVCLRLERERTTYSTGRGVTK